MHGLLQLFKVLILSFFFHVRYFPSIGVRSSLTFSSLPFPSLPFPSLPFHSFRSFNSFLLHFHFNLFWTLHSVWLFQLPDYRPYWSGRPNRLPQDNLPCKPAMEYNKKSLWTIWNHLRQLKSHDSVKTFGCWRRWREKRKMGLEWTTECHPPFICSFQEIVLSEFGRSGCDWTRAADVAHLLVSHSCSLLFFFSPLSCSLPSLSTSLRCPFFDLQGSECQ